MARKAMSETQDTQHSKASTEQTAQSRTEKTEAEERYFQPRDLRSGQVYQDWALI